MRKTIRLWSILVLVGCVAAYAQIGAAGAPIGFKTRLKSLVPVVQTRSIDAAKLLAEDAVDSKRKDIPYRFGYNIDVNLSLENAGVWETLEDGDRLWRLQINSPGAFSINLGFARYHLPPGARLFMYNVEKSGVIGAFTSANNQPDNQFATTLVAGDQVIVEYYEPKTPQFKGELVINRVTHAYKDVFAYAKALGSSGTCNMNVACPDGAAWQNEVRAVAMIVVNNGTAMCSGALINNVNSNGTPYFLTANHCSGNNDFSTWVFWFNWQSPTCINPSTPPSSQSVVGSTLKSRYTTSDFCLVQLNTAPPAGYNVYYAGWNRADVASTSSVGIHHPAGDIKKISFDDNAPVSSGYNGATGSDHWKIVSWDRSTTTEGGSSGSPLFDQNHRITGQLHGGGAACGNTLSDYYGKFAVSWAGGGASDSRLSSWLDPLSTNVVTLDGYNPGGTPPVCNTVTTFPFTEGFKSGVTPACWQEAPDPGSMAAWFYIAGNGTGYPAAAHGGLKNACLWDESTGSNRNKLISPRLDLTALTNPTLTFWHTQAFWTPDQDILRVFYRTSATGTWTLLTTYDSSIPTWTQETITLPNSTSAYYVAFEGDAKYGRGVCVDDITITGQTVSQFTLTTTATNGTVTKSPDQSAYDSNTVVTLTATPALGYTFTGWSGDTSGTTNPLSFPIRKNRSITANFAIKTYTLSITATNGTVTKSPNQSTYDSNTAITLTATPAIGYTFTGWSGDTTGTTNPLSFPIRKNRSITANFSIKTYTLSITAANGTVTKSPDQSAYDSNTVVTLTATPALGYTFTGWSGDTTGTTNPLSFPIRKNRSITANFALKTYSLSITATNGTVTKSPNQSTYDSNSAITLTATPVVGYTFTGWSGDLGATTNPATITMNSAKSVVAKFICRTNIPVAAGWNMISLNIHPQDSSVSSIFDSIRGLELVKNNGGEVYWPAYSVNAIGSIRTGQGYKVYTDSSDTIHASGTAIEVAATPIPLLAGWNLTAYLPQSDMPIASALVSVTGQVAIVKNNSGKVYWPEYSVNTIGNMLVGQGYKICMKNPATLTYPSVPVVPGLAKTAGAESVSSRYEARHFRLNLNSGNNATVLAKRVDINGVSAPDSSEIGAFDGKGNIVGAGVVLSGVSAFSVWGDNPRTTWKDGCDVGEKIQFRLWNGSQEFPLEFENTNSPGYAEDGIFAGGLLVPLRLFISKFALRIVGSNPFGRQIVIAFDVPSIKGGEVQDVEINMYSVNGALVHQFAKGKYATGRYRVTWYSEDGNELKLGARVYLVRMKAGSFQTTQRLLRMQ